MPTLEPELKITQPESAASSNDLSVSVDSLPKLVACFDLNTLSHRKLKAIASDLKVPGYSRMTKVELCKALLAL